MRPDELMFRLSQFSDSLYWKMESLINGAGGKVSSVVSVVQSSSAGEQYRHLVAALKELLQRIGNSLAQNHIYQDLGNLARNQGEKIFLKIQWSLPILRRLPRDKILIVGGSLLVGIAVGRWSVTRIPRLQPVNMVAVVCGSYTGIEGVAVCQISVPRIERSDQVLIRVMSTSLDRTDLLSVSGWGRVERRRPHAGFSLGRDFCGHVVEAGIDVPHVGPGDKVWGAVPYYLSGTMSENIVVSGSLVERMPNNLNWEGGATVPYSAFQVWSAVVGSGHLSPRETGPGLSVLVIDGCSDTGSLCSQLCCVWGCMVTVLCTPHTVPLAHALGVHTVVAARETPEECLADLEDCGPFQLIIIAGDLLPASACQPLLSEKGAITSTLPPRLPTDGWGFLRRLFLPLWRTIFRPAGCASQDRVREALQHVGQAVESGRVQPVLNSVLRPAEVKTGLSRLAAEETVGKTVVMFE